MAHQHKPQMQVQIQGRVTVSKPIKLFVKNATENFYLIKGINKVTSKFTAI